MNIRFLKSLGRLAPGSQLKWVGALALAPMLSMATDEIWSNSGFISDPPSIDATHFFNDGEISVLTGLAFETSNTRTYTNYGTMSGRPGFYFYNSPSINGARKPADIFFNGPTGIINAEDPGSFFSNIPIFGGGIVLGLSDSSQLWINASNIINKGVLAVGANGWMKLAGTNINLSRSGLLVTSIVPRGSFNDDEQGLFLPDAGITDLYWNQTNIPAPPGIATSPIWRMVGGSGLASAPSHPIFTAGNRPGGSTGFSLSNPIADSWASTNGGIFLIVTNLVGLTNITDETFVPGIDMTNVVEETILIPTNITRQAAFIGVSDPTVMSVGVEWFPSSLPTNYFMAPQVHIESVSSNVVSASPEVNSLYLLDILASETNRGVLLNDTSAPNVETYRPSPYILSRARIRGLGALGLGYPEADFLYARDTFSNNVVAADFAAYGAFVSNLPSEPPYVLEGTFTNLPGRVQIYADTLDMNRTRLRGEGHVIVKANEFLGSTNAIVDAEHLSFQLTSTRGNLEFTSLAKERIARTKGDLYVWSGVWVNDLIMVTPNWTVITNLDTNGVVVSLDATNTPLTNLSIVNLHALLVNAENMLTTLPVLVWDLVLRGDSVVVDDQMNVVQNFYTDATSFTLNGRITFTEGSWLSSYGRNYFPPLADWVHTNSPNLLYFTNNGALGLPNSIRFGSDRAVPYNVVVNNGTISTISLNVNSAYFQNSGSIVLQNPSRPGAFDLRAQTASLEDGENQVGMMRVNADNLRLRGYTLEAERLNLNVPGILSDIGFASSNSIVVTDGFHLMSRPAGGDLLGTTIRTVLGDFIEVDHTWAGADRGPSTAGYQDNAAVGSLVISAAAARDPLARFLGAQPGSALYVDFLDLSELGENWNLWMEIDPSLTIYYATARLGFEPPVGENGIPQTPEEFLNGQFGGRLQWVSAYAGGESSVAVIVDGVTVFMNVALRNSQIIDSDSDGIPNYFDSTPLGGEEPSTAGLVLRSALTSLAGAPQSKAFSMTWTAAPNAVYAIEVATDLARGDWQPFQSFTNSSPAAQVMTFSDPSSSDRQRFYRIRIQQ